MSKTIKFTFQNVKHEVNMDFIFSPKNNNIFYNFEENIYHLNDNLDLVFINTPSWNSDVTSNVSVTLKIRKGIYNLYSVEKVINCFDRKSKNDLFNFYEKSVKKIIENIPHIIDEHIKEYEEKLNYLIDIKKDME